MKGNDGHRWLWNWTAETQLLPPSSRLKIPLFPNCLLNQSQFPRVNNDSINIPIPTIDHQSRSISNLLFFYWRRNNFIICIPIHDLSLINTFFLSTSDKVQWPWEFTTSLFFPRYSYERLPIWSAPTSGMGTTLKFNSKTWAKMENPSIHFGANRPPTWSWRKRIVTPTTWRKGLETIKK